MRGRAGPTERNKSVGLLILLSLYLADVASRADGQMGWDLMCKVGLMIDADRGQLVLKETDMKESKSV